MKEINIRFEPISEIEQRPYSRFPFFTITIDGVVQEDVKRFCVDLNANRSIVDDNSYTIERFTRYPDEYRRRSHGSTQDSSSS